MDGFEPRARRSYRVPLVGLALLGLLTVVALASRSAGHGHAQTTASPVYVSYALTVFLILFVLAIPVAAWAYLGQLRDLGGGPSKSFASRVGQGLVKVALLGMVGFAIHYLHNHHASIFAPFHNLGRSGASTTGKPGGSAGTKQPHFEWPVLWIAVAVAIAGIAAYLVRRRKRAPFEERAAAPSMADDVADSIDDAIDDLEAEPNARVAVIAAYARMETAFARHGLRRRVSETPFEYLRRILLGISGRADAVGTLTGLFEQAKFSRHAIDTSMKDEALGALRAIRDDLRGLPA